MNDVEDLFKEMMDNLGENGIGEGLSELADKMEKKAGSKARTDYRKLRTALIIEIQQNKNLFNLGEAMLDDEDNVEYLLNATRIIDNINNTLNNWAD